MEQNMGYLVEDDPDIAELIADESRRIETTLDLIAAENHAPVSVIQAQGAIFSMKAAEGYPGRRFHAGCNHTDRLENMAVSRAKQLFEADHANVQPHSGVSANLAVYFSVLEVGDRVLSMQLDHGGHLSHGDAASITSKCFRFKHYGLSPETERIDYDGVQRQAAAFRPKMIVAGASSYPRLIDYERMADIANSVNAYLFVDMAHLAGLVAAGVIPSPVPHSDFVTFTTYKTMRGGRGGVILCRQPYQEKIDRAVFPGAQGTPSLNMIAAKAVSFKLAMSAPFEKNQKKTLENASDFANAFEKKGYRIVTGGTDTHLVLIDLRPKGLRGNEAEAVLESVGIIVNRNVVPFDNENVRVAGGIRIGSPAMTVRGMGTAEVYRIVDLMDRAMGHRHDSLVLAAVADEVAALCRKFPVYPQHR